MGKLIFWVKSNNLFKNKLLKNRPNFLLFISVFSGSFNTLFKAVLFIRAYFYLSKDLYFNNAYIKVS